MRFLEDNASVSDSTIINIMSDSKYCLNIWAENWICSWKKNNWIKSNRDPVKNKDIIQHIDNLQSKYININYIHVKGHNGNKYNEIVDSLAVDARKFGAAVR